MCKSWKIYLAIILVSFNFACNSSNAEKTSKVETQPTPEIVSNKPKIVAFGDSLTAGFGLPEKESYPYLLQERLNADGYNYEVVNAGISGDTSLGGVDRIDWSLEQENVEIVVLELGGNDILRNVPPEIMKKNIDQIIRRTKAKNFKILFCGLSSPKALNEYQQQISAAFTTLAKEHKLPFIPFVLKDVAGNPKFNQADGIHPNAEGEKIMTDTIYQGLKPLLKK